MPHATGLTAHGISPADAAYLTGRGFFPALISGPFADGPAVAFGFATAACLVAAVAAALRGGKYASAEPGGMPDAGTRVPPQPGSPAPPAPAASGPGVRAIGPVDFPPADFPPADFPPADFPPARRVAAVEHQGRPAAMPGHGPAPGRVGTGRPPGTALNRKAKAAAPCTS